MISKRVSRAAAAAAALVAGGIFAAAGPAQPAVAFFSGGLFLDVAPQSPATLVASGAAVDVTVQVTCNADLFADVSVQVTEQVAGHKIATGRANVPVGCTGSHQNIVVRVPADSGLTFAKGDALASADLFGCISPNFFCGEETGSATITIKR
jgi:hypothetical protein